MSKPKPEEPALSRPARKKTTDSVQLFLAAYPTTGSITAAARIAGIARSMHYERLAQDPAYQQAWARAKEELCYTIEGELFRRAVHGEREPIFYRGKKVATITRRSDSWLMFVARGAMRSKYGEHLLAEVSVNIAERLQQAHRRLIEMRRPEDFPADPAQSA